jgi:hypothetical protein
MRTSYPLKRTRRVRWSVLTSAAALLATLLVGLSPSSVSASTLSTIPCAKTFTELIGTRYRSLGNSGGEEIYAGVPDLGTAARRTGANATWVAGDNFVSFTLDPVNDKLISSMSNSAGSWSVEYPNLAAQISTFHPGKSIADLDVLKIFMRNGDAQLGYVNVRDVEFDGTPIDADPYAAGMQDFTPSVFPPTVALDTWTITGLDFTDPAGWTMTARIERVGAFSTSQEATRVEFALGDGDLGAANVSVSGGGDVPEASGPAQFAVSVTGAMFTDVTVDYETTDGTATAPDDYEATSGSLTFPACDPAAPQTVDVPIVDDDDAEDNETFTLDLTSATGASIDAGTAVSTIVDDDEQLCNGLAPTVSGLVGTAGDDVIIGTEGSDVIDAGGGNDTVCGLGGNDTIKLGNGRVPNARRPSSSRREATKASATAAGACCRSSDPWNTSAICSTRRRARSSMSSRSPSSLRSGRPRVEAAVGTGGRLDLGPVGVEGLGRPAPRPGARRGRSRCPTPPTRR